MSYSIDTLLLHNQYKHDPQTGAVNVPIYNTSTFHQFDVDTFGKYDYSRSGNPTREALEDIIALLEGGTKGFAFASGIAAISTAFLLLSQGDHVLISEDVYGGTYRIITEVLSRYGVSHTFVDMTNLEEIKQNIKPNTKLFYVETPSNPLLKVTDIRAVSTLAKSIDALTFVDNTFLTPLFQKPLDLGADVVLHSATKFIAGHSDVTAGLAVVKMPNSLKNLAFTKCIRCYSRPARLFSRTSRSKTLHVRLEHSATNANKIAHYLQEHAKVQNVYYPGLQAHLGFDIQQSQATSAGAVLSFTLQSEDALRQFLSKVKLPVFAVSLGAVESILSYPAKMSHAALSQARDERGISNSLLRLSVGLENVDDLISDFENALSYVEEPVNA